MFYCAPCALKNEWPDYGARASYGKCEVCGKTAGCNDVPSSYLPIPKRKVTEKVKVRRTTLSDIEQLAVWLHLDMCRLDHQDDCSWLGETDIEQDWTEHYWHGPTHTRWLNKASRMVDEFDGETGALIAYNTYRRVKNI